MFQLSRLILLELPQYGKGSYQNKAALQLQIKEHRVMFVQMNRNTISKTVSTILKFHKALLIQGNH